MSATPTVDKSPSLRSTPSSIAAQSQRHPNLAPTTVRTVVTIPPWAHDEPPSPTDQPHNDDRHGSAIVLGHKPPSLISSFGNPTCTDREDRSRWYSFVRSPNRNPQVQEKRTPLPAWHYAGFSLSDNDSANVPHGLPSSESPWPASRNMPNWNPTWRSKIEFQPNHRSDYTQIGSSAVRYDDESGSERPTRSKKGFRMFILSNVYVPLLFRFINITFTIAALVIAVHIRDHEMQYNLMGALGSSPILVIIFAPLTLVHVMVAIYLEYFGRPLGLWRTSGKLAHTLLEVCFICAWSAALSLCFDNYFTSRIPCASPASIAWYSQIPKAQLSSPGVGEIGEALCDNQLALICLVGVGLIMYCINLVISLFRIFEKVKCHAGFRLLV